MASKLKQLNATFLSDYLDITQKLLTPCIRI
jgi:hypothetical protein